MGSKPSKDDGDYYAKVALNSTTKGTRLALTTASAAMDADDIVANVTYKVQLTPLSSDAAWVDLTGGTAAAPASKATETAGFWLMPGETELAKTSTNTLSAIMLSGTGTLLLTRLVT